MIEYVWKTIDNKLESATTSVGWTIQRNNMESTENSVIEDKTESDAEKVSDS